MSKISFIGIQRLIKKKFVVIIIVIMFLVPLGIILVDRNTAKNTEHGNRKALAAQPTVTAAVPEPLVFRDNKTNAVLSIQLAPGLPTTGQFSFYAPDKGYYNGVIPLLQSGKQIAHPKGQITGQFSPQQGGPPVSATVKMEGEINTIHNTATLNIWVDKAFYHLQTATVDIGQASAVAKQSVSYTAAHNWSGLYNLFSSDIQATNSLAQFTQSMSDNSTPTIISADLNGTGQIITIGGYTYFAQPITITVKQQDGTTAAYHSTEYFVLEKGTWRLLTTDTPK